MTDRKIRVGITHGDINGVGYEVILKAFADAALSELCIPILYGAPKVALYHRKALELPTHFILIASPNEAQSGRLNMITVYEDEAKIDFGIPSSESGNLALRSLEQATRHYKEDLLDVLITAPINKNCIQCADFPFVGHTEYLQASVGEKSEPLMILTSKSLRVALVTTHMPLRDVPAAITQTKVEQKVELLYRSLLRDFNIPAPRIAVLALNPHAGENGLLGKEEKEVILPAIENVKKKGIPCFGAYAADGFFGSGLQERFDAVLAMYHDQGLAPFKALSMGNGVNYTAGLPLVRTSPDHGTAYDIAGKGQADANSFRQALYLALDVWRNRQLYDEARENPLQKTYHDRHDDSDKLTILPED